MSGRADGQSLPGSWWQWDRANFGVVLGEQLVSCRQWQLCAQARGASRSIEEGPIHTRIPSSIQTPLQGPPHSAQFTPPPALLPPPLRFWANHSNLLVFSYSFLPSVVVCNMVTGYEIVCTLHTQRIPQK